jgi:hypothetical protein
VRRLGRLEQGVLVGGRRAKRLPSDHFHNTLPELPASPLLILILPANTPYKLANHEKEV